MVEIQLKDYLPYIGNNIVVRSEKYLSNGNGNEFGILNGIYPLYDSRNKPRKTFWQYTTENNSTGQSLVDGKLLLRPLSDVVIQLKDGTIPIIECARLAGFDVDDNIMNYRICIRDNTAILEHRTKTSLTGFEIDFDNFGFDIFREFKRTTKFSVVDNPLKIVEYLYSKGFDLSNLIEKKLALNINFYPQFL